MEVILEQLKWYPLNCRLDCPQSWSQHFVGEKHILPLSKQNH